ncbi:uncharacterized protein ARMOST_12506 [Armillaria ostoyae]|uniref:Nephrocystin 3-like N-terminal domain-containing protein n=1 Tax=Armillaria ostoyae TaxID=47428 RepID=A0A284RK57_ARMOS|nr:uncharacterized protein ARMOST_12506 [Armillaria ostoyae]
MDWRSDLMKKALSDPSPLSRDEAPRRLRDLILLVTSSNGYRVSIELLNLPSESDKRSYYLNIFAGKHSKQTIEFKVKKKKAPGTTPAPKWLIDLDLSDIEEGKTFEVDVHCCKGKEDRGLGFYEASIGEIVIGKNNTIDVKIKSKSSCPDASLKILLEDPAESTQSAGEDISTAPQSRPSNVIAPGNQDTPDLPGPQLGPMSATSVEDDDATAGKVVEETPPPKEPSEWVSNLIDGIDTVKNMIDTVKSVHPAASVALGFMSSAVDILKQQTELDNLKLVLRLYEAMILTYKAASDDRLLWKQKKLKPIYTSLFHTTNECGMLIKRYTGKNRLQHILSLRVTQKAEELIEGFANLRQQLDSGVPKDTLVVTQDVRAEAGIVAMEILLKDLRPRRLPRPRLESKCMPGTRVETIHTLVSWIAESNDRVLWCSGLAGTGKSSLVGTLHKLLSIHMGSRSRLAAFIHYDRTEYLDSSRLITFIAYSLGIFDQRIGDAIAKALHTSHAAVSMPASESRTQFRFLVQEPLETLPELQDEGPLVVIIDGFDESDASKDLLEVLADGFGPKLPFMRLIVFSQPEERISRVFKDHKHVHHFPLDISSPILDDDIRYFIRQRFAKIKDDTVWGTYTKETVVTQLAERASGLFIWAATVCSFFCDFPSLPRLKALLETTIPTDAMNALTILYQTTLDTVVSEVSGTKEPEDIRRCIRAVLGALIVSRGKMTVPMLPELVLQEGDPSAQLIVDRLRSMVQQVEVVDPFIPKITGIKKSHRPKLIHKSFDDFLQDHDRCGDEWFIDVKEFEKELARRCVLSLTTFFKNWTPPSANSGSSGIYRRATILDQYYCVVPSHIGDYAVNVLGWHLDALLGLGIDTYRPLFERYFLFWLEILYAFLESPAKHYTERDLRFLFPDNALLKVISMINAEVTDQSLRTYFYHAFTFWDRFKQYSTKYRRVNPACVYTHAISISPSANFLCRDWGRSSGVNAPFDKERLLALMPWSRLRYFVSSRMFQGSRYIQFEAEPSDIDVQMSKVTGEPIQSRRSFLFDVDTGRIAEPPSPPSILLPFPDLLLPSSYNTSTSHLSIDASVQAVRLVRWDTWRGDGSQYFFNSTRYEIIEKHDSDLQDAMISNVEDNKQSMFISIVSAQTSRCDNYLLPAIGGDSSVVQYAHGLIVVDKRSGLMLNIEPRTPACKKWVVLADGANGVHTFAVREEDGSRLLLGLTAAADKISLREWETSTGTLCCTRIYGRNTDHSDFGYDGPSTGFRCLISPDGSKVAVTMVSERPARAYILDIMSGSSVDITDLQRQRQHLQDARGVTWFPDSKRIAYFRSWQCEHGLCDECCDLVVQRLANNQITTIHRWYENSNRSVSDVQAPDISVTPDGSGSRVITQDEESFRTWDVSDL